MKKTYNNIIDSFKWFADNHYQLNGFIDNHPLQVNKSEGVDYPMLTVYPGTSTINGNEMILNFNVFIFDILKSDYTNEREILSDNLLIANDFVNYYARNEEELGFYLDETTVTMEPFAENFESSEDTDIEDDVAGWYIDINIHIDNTMNNCNLPMLEIDSKTDTSFRLYAGQSNRDAGFVRDLYGNIIPDDDVIDKLYLSSGKIHLLINDVNDNPIEEINYLKIDGEEITDFVWDGSELVTESTYIGIIEAELIYIIGISY